MFAVVNPIANILQCVGPTMVAMTIGIGFANGMGVTLPFWITAGIAVVSLIMILLFKPANVKAADDKYRSAAGKPLDDILVGRQ